MLKEEQRGGGGRNDEGAERRANREGEGQGGGRNEGRSGHTGSVCGALRQGQMENSEGA